jgi:hypothetical protein
MDCTVKKRKANRDASSGKPGEADLYSLKKNMVKKITWKDFRECGLLWFVNRIIHLFGYAIVMEMDKDTGEITKVYPARCRFRGFTEDIETEGFKTLTAHIHRTIGMLKEDTESED